MSGSLIPFRRRRRVAPVSRIRTGPPTPDTRETWEVAVDDYPIPLAVFTSRTEALDFSNGFNLGARWTS